MEGPVRSRFVPITRKVNLIIIGTLVVGIGALTGFLAGRLTVTIQNDTETALADEATIVYESIRVLMLSGSALTTQQFLDNLDARMSGTDIWILRRDGESAFTDNETIRNVNAVLGEEVFAPRVPVVPARPEIEQERFALAVSQMPAPQQFTGERGGRWIAQIYRPLLNTPICFSCHSDDHLVRGVVDVRADITSAIRERNGAIAAGAAAFVIITFGVGLIISQFMHRSVIRPIRLIRDVCLAVTDGDFSQRVTPGSNDEVGSLGDTVNTMARGLHERFELRKYVSSATLTNILNDQTGQQAMLTMFFSDIRGFTSFSERHTPSDVVLQLNDLLSRQSQIIAECGGDIDKYVGDEIVAIFTGDDGPVRAARAALRIQDQLAGFAQREDPLRVGIGINCGDVILGMVGSQQRADFTVIGDTVNIASRLCDVAPPGEIIVSEALRKRLPKTADTTGPYGVALKGKSARQRVYKLVSLGEQ